MPTNHVSNDDRRGPLSAERGADGHELANLENQPGLVPGAGCAPLSRHDQNHDPTQWVSLLSQAIVEDEAQRLPNQRVMPRHDPVVPRFPWFHLVTLCGLAVLLLPVGQGWQHHERSDPVQGVAVAPSVLGWRQERSAEALSFGNGSALTYRGLQVPERRPVSTALELTKIGRSALVPLRIALGQQLVAQPGVYRIELHNLPAAAHVSAGVRAADGAWIIEGGGFRDVTIALMSLANERLAIRIEGRSRDGLVWVHVITGAAEADATETPAPRISATGPKGPNVLPAVEVVRVPPPAPVSTLPPPPEIVVAKPAALTEARTSVIPSAASHPPAAAQSESRPKAPRDRSVGRPSQKSTTDVGTTSSWRDGAFEKDRN